MLFGNEVHSNLVCYPSNIATQASTSFSTSEGQLSGLNLLGRDLILYGAGLDVM